MQADRTAEVVRTVTSAPDVGRWAFWATFLGGFLLAAGLLLPIVAFVLVESGLSAGFPSAAEVRDWDLFANILEAAGFLSGFVGLAGTLRAPRPAFRGAAGWQFSAVVAGSLLIVSGIAVASVAAGYIIPVGSLFFVDVGEIVGRCLQAPGFILVFAALAMALGPASRHPRTGSGSLETP